MKIKRVRSGVASKLLAAGFSLLLSGCHFRGGEPSAAEISQAYRAELNRINTAGLGHPDLYGEV